MAESGYVINGITYEVPSLWSFSMDEYQILQDLSGLTVMDFVKEDNEEQNAVFWNAGFQRTLLLVAFMRGNPDVKRSEAEKLIGKVPLTELLARADADEDDASPPDVSAPVGTTSTNGTSGALSEGDLTNFPEEIPEATGIGKSATPQDKGRELLERGSRLT